MDHRLFRRVLAVRADMGASASRPVNSSLSRSAIKTACIRTQTTKSKPKAKPQSARTPPTKPAVRSARLSAKSGPSKKSLPVIEQIRSSEQQLAEAQAQTEKLRKETSPHLRKVRREGALLTLAARGQQLTKSRISAVLAEREIAQHGVTGGPRSVHDVIPQHGQKRGAVKEQVDHFKASLGRASTRRQWSTGELGAFVDKNRKIATRQQQLGMRTANRWLGKEGQAKALLIAKHRRQIIAPHLKQETTLPKPARDRKLRIRQLGLREVERRENVIVEREKAIQAAFERSVRTKAAIRTKTQEREREAKIQELGLEEVVGLEEEALSLRVQRAEEWRANTARNEARKARKRAKNKSARIRKGFGARAKLQHKEALRRIALEPVIQPQGPSKLKITK